MKELFARISMVAMVTSYNIDNKENSQVAYAHRDDHVVYCMSPQDPVSSIWLPDTHVIIKMEEMSSSSYGVSLLALSSPLFCNIACIKWSIHPTHNMSDEDSLHSWIWIGC